MEIWVKAMGFTVQWDGTADSKIAVTDLKWDKYYIDIYECAQGCR